MIFNLIEGLIEDGGISISDYLILKGALEACLLERLKNVLKKEKL